MSRIAHSWAGAGVTDVTDLVHPRVAAQCVRAVRLIGLDVAGLDVVADDISRPLEEQGGVILEVNAEPTIAFHFPPLCDRARPVCEAIIESLFPDGQSGRIPLAMISGCGDRTGAGRWLAALWRQSRAGVGRASSEGLFFGCEQAKMGDQANLAGSLATLLCPEVDVAVLERDLASIRHQGLGLDRVNLLILTRLAPDSDAELERAARVLIAAVDPKGVVVVEANDTLAAAITQSFAGTVVVVSDAPLPVVGQGLARATVCPRDTQVVVVTPDAEHTVVLNQGVIAQTTASGHFGGLLAAVGAVWAMGVPVEAIAARIVSAIHAGEL
jgi:cyanophycin synthetase